MNIFLLITNLPRPIFVGIICIGCYQVFYVDKILGLFNVIVNSSAITLNLVNLSKNDNI